MRDFKGIEIARAALHVVAPRAGRLEQTEEELEFPLSEDIAAFLGRHTGQGLVDGQARAAKFVTPGPDRAEGLATHILNNPEHLVADSSTLAQLLYDASQGDDRVSDGTLAALLCSAADGSGARHDFIALLKLDPSSQYQTRIDTKNGRRIVRLARSDGILPSVNERLQKAAFIRKADNGVEYPVLLVDRQRKGDLVSEFFLVKFLGAELIHDATSRTTILWREVTNARNAIQDDIPADERAAVDRYIQGATSGTRIDVDSFGDSVPITDTEVRERFKGHITASLPDRQFELDRELTEKLHRQRKFEGDNGLRLAVKAEHYEDMISAADDPDRPHGKVITIRTTTWNELT